MGCFKHMSMCGNYQLQLRVNFLCGIVRNLDDIELGDNVGVAFLQEFLHMVIDDIFQGTRCESLESMCMVILIETHV
jgi:hypothetical protein